VRRVRPKNKKNYKTIIIYKLKQFIKWLPLLATFLVIGYLSWLFINSNFFKAQIKITNISKNIDNKEILASVNHLIKNPLNIDKIKQTITENPWVKDLKISRTWNNIDVEITPQTIVFNWHNFENNNKGYVNKYGELFIPENIIKNDKTTIISDKNNIKNTFNNLIKYQQIFKAKIDKFIKTNIETIVLQNGARIILGQKLQTERLAKLQKHYNKFKMRNNSIVDLRYSNGFSKTN
jgi:cell division septal protein FtsQ